MNWLVRVNLPTHWFQMRVGSCCRMPLMTISGPFHQLPSIDHSLMLPLIYLRTNYLIFFSHLLFLWIIYLFHSVSFLLVLLLHMMQVCMPTSPSHANPINCLMAKHESMHVLLRHWTYFYSNSLHFACVSTHLWKQRWIFENADRYGSIGCVHSTSMCSQFNLYFWHMLK